LWYPDFKGIMYAGDEKGLIIGPHFSEKSTAQKIFDDHISKWNSKFVYITFIEDVSEYEFVCYQDPKSSFSKINFGFYRSSMNKEGNYSKSRDEIKSSGCRLGLFYEGSNGFEVLGEPIEVNSVKIISTQDVDSNSYEAIARKVSGNKSQDINTL